jgi:hypothetical protein
MTNEWNITNLLGIWKHLQTLCQNPTIMIKTFCDYVLIFTM